MAEQAGEAPVEGPPEGLGEAPRSARRPETPAPGAAAALRPITEEMALQCAHYVLTQREDESLYLIGSELGGDKVGLADRDILYLNKGSNAGVKAGDVYTLHHAAYTVEAPRLGQEAGDEDRDHGLGQGHPRPGRLGHARSSSRPASTSTPATT